LECRSGATWAVIEACLRKLKLTPSIVLDQANARIINVGRGSMISWALYTQVGRQCGYVGATNLPGEPQSIAVHRVGNTAGWRAEHTSQRAVVLVLEKVRTLVDMRTEHASTAMADRAARCSCAARSRSMASCAIASAAAFGTSGRG
jgi:hypothetical protein